MPNKLTDAEVKKALSLLLFNRNCNIARYANKFVTLGEVIDLIDRQDFKIHQLEKQVSEIQNANLIDFKATIGNYKAENESLKAEVERLKVDIALYKSVKKIVVPNITDEGVEFKEYEPLFQKIKAEAYKEFAEKLEERIQKYETLLCEVNERRVIFQFSIIELKKYIDNLLNELVGDESGN